MNLRLRFLTASALLLSCSVSMAGMPSFEMNDVVRLRLQDISFFGVLILICAFLIQKLWNAMAKDFTRLPVLSYKRAISLTVIWGLALLLVLSMISGARELLTPGAWRREGVTYKVNTGDATPVSRKAAMETLGGVLKDYALQHGNRFPSHQYVTEIPAAAWLVPNGSGTRYVYLPGFTSTNGNSIIALEPREMGDPRFILRADGAVEPLTNKELDKEFSRIEP